MSWEGGSLRTRLRADEVYAEIALWVAGVRWVQFRERGDADVAMCDF